LFLLLSVRDSIVCKAHRLCVSLNAMLESNNAEEKKALDRSMVP